MKRLCAGLVLAGGMISAGGAMADDNVLTVQKLLDDCNAPLGSTSNMYCLGFFGGAGEIMAFSKFGVGYGSKPEGKKFLQDLAICGDSTYGAERHAFKNWAQAHPEQWTQPASIGVVVALTQTWPCPAK
jgi:hypothetical protein